MEYLALGAHGIQMNTHSQTKVYGNLGNKRVSATILSITQAAPPSDAKEFDVSSSYLDRPGRVRC